MVRGGVRKGAGRPKGAKDTAPRRISATQAADMTEQMSFRCTAAQKQRLETAARRRGIDGSELMRQLIDQL